MFGPTHYVPILKGMIGEYMALREFQSPKLGFTPMIDVPPLKWDFARQEPAKTVDKHIKRLAGKINKCWEPMRHIFFDLYMIPELEVMADGRHPLVYIFEVMRGKSGSRGPRRHGVCAIPVTGLKRHLYYQKAVEEVVATDRRGVCLRLESQDFEDAESLEQRITKLLSDLQVVPLDTDLVLDLKAILPSLSGPTIFAVREMIKTLPLLSHWRTFTLAASAFPMNLSQIQPGQITVLPRTEWTMWQALVAGKSKLPRLPTFGDYGIRHPLYPEADIDPKVLKTVPNVRYTTTNDWLVLKGRNSDKEDKRMSFIDLCKIMEKRLEFCGFPFSWGDERISACANGAGTNGNPSVWTAIATSHHLAFIKLQIASFSLP
jgi:Beta protein